MYQLIKQLLLITFLLIIIDRSTGFYFDKLLPSVKCGYYGKINSYLSTVEAYDIIIYGNSRGMHQYVPKVFENNLSLRAINAGIDGAGLPFYKALIEYQLKHHKPKLIIIDINNRELESSIIGDKENALNYLSPFLASKPDLKASLALSTKDELLYNSGLYRYNTKFYGIIRSLSCSDKLQNGYSPYVGIAAKDMRDYKEPESGIDKERIELLESIIELCKQSNVKLLFVFSPKRDIDDRSFKSRKLLNNIFDKYNLPYWDFTVNDNFKAKNIFYDAAHLNQEGAALYSKFLSMKILSSRMLN
ncbi:hypothetical protein NF867_12395 [Solitalea sp. MAHUQ-68]|uniref:SGNH/GDSL hydrolase family protein n=1 Tax=Solitalea agri TaxID=2953739 RepID=A0A9X2JDI7_9SPHI|nr:hypothetical protein [Solitalea agri]MCO4293664.1 hypothetical protein [Solitalea agri]